MRRLKPVLLTLLLIFVLLLATSTSGGTPRADAHNEQPIAGQILPIAP